MRFVLFCVVLGEARKSLESEVYVTDLSRNSETGGGQCLAGLTQPRAGTTTAPTLPRDLAAEAKETLDVSRQPTLALLLHLVVQGRESHMVERQVEEEGFAGDWLEVWGKLHQIGLLSNKGGIQTEGFQSVGEWLQGWRYNQKYYKQEQNLQQSYKTDT